MPEYESAMALIGDAELRSDGLGSAMGILVVEGPDDKRAFLPHVAHSSQIVPAGGRRLLLSAHEKMSTEYRSRIIFVTDCDYEVRRGALVGAKDLVITRFTDLESDLIGLGVVENLAIELIPRALSSQEELERISSSIHKKAQAISCPLGRIRMAAQPLGVPLGLDKLKIHNYWNRVNAEFDFAKVISALHTKVAAHVTAEAWKELVLSMPDDDGMCHGKDLVRSLALILKQDYGVDISGDEIARMMRMSLREDSMKKWDVARRIRDWEEANGRRVLK